VLGRELKGQEMYGQGTYGQGMDGQGTYEEVLVLIGKDRGVIGQ
jgi:hypothetical protein